MMIHQPEYTTRSFGRVKIYPDGRREYMMADRPIFSEPGWELSDLSDNLPDGKGPTEDPEGQIKLSGLSDSFERAMRRARAKVRELALANDFTFFVTLTLNKEKVDRYDMVEITRKLNNWLDNQVRRKGLRYILVPERHKDGAIHFHGFFNDALRAVDSGHLDKRGHVIYNLPGWRLGFTTAIRLYGEYDSAVAYVCKYIGKQNQKPGGRWYYSGGELRRPEVVLCDLSPEDAPTGAHSFRIEDAGLWITMWTEKGDETREGR